MTDLLISIFIDDNASQDQQRKEYGNLSSIVGIIVNILLAGLKIFISFVAGSIAIFGDGMNNLFDSGSAIISLITFQITSKPADEDHPFGHARFEYISSSLVALLIIYVAITLFSDSIGKIQNPTSTDLGALGIILILVSIIFKFWLYLFYTKIGNRINSGLILANATDSISDVLSTGIILIALVLSPIIGINLDGPMGILVSIFIFKSGIDILAQTFNHLVGTKPDADTVENLEEFIESYQGVLGTHDIVVHDYGPGNKFVTIHIEVDASVDVMESHELMDRIERDMKDEKGVALTAHMDPVELDNPRSNELKEVITKMVKDYNPTYSIHDFRIVDSGDWTNVVFDILVPTGEKKTNEQIEDEISKKITTERPDLKPVLQIDRDYIN